MQMNEGVQTSAIREGSSAGLSQPERYLKLTKRRKVACPQTVGRYFGDESDSYCSSPNRVGCCDISFTAMSAANFVAATP